jgi:predicted enzyme related to lactoylglutathione lyase
MTHLFRDTALLILAGLVAACSTRQSSTPGGPATDEVTRQFVWQELLTEDVQAARRFYGSLFGWQFEETERLGKPYLVVRAGGDYVAGIVPVERQRSDEPVTQWLSYLLVGDVDVAAQGFADAGGKILVSPTDLRNSARAAVVTDPAGALLGLVSTEAELPELPADPPLGSFFWRDYFAQDVQVSLDLYRQFPGYRVQEESHSGTLHYVIRHGALSKPLAGLIPIGDSPVRPNWLPYVRVADPAALARRTSELGGSVLLEPNPEARDGSVAIVADPNGGALALQKWPIS